jgi:hypothetical protein
LSQFTPVSIRFDPPDAPNHLGSAIMKTIGRGVSPKVSWGPILTLLTGAVSFGMLPLIFLPRRLRAVSADDRALLDYARQCLERAREPRMAEEPRVLKVASILALIAIPATLVAILLNPGFASADLWAVTYGFGRLSDDEMTAPMRAVQTTWIWFFTLAYLCQFLAAWRAARVLGRQIAQLNDAFPDQQIQPARRPFLFGLESLLWLLLSAPLVYFGAAWAIPMMLAGSAQRRYIKQMSAPMRASLGRAMQRNVAADPSRGRMNIPAPMRVPYANKECA